MVQPTALPYGLRDIKLTAYTDATGTTLGDTKTDLPYARTLSFSEAEEFEELRGDDKVVTTRGKGPSVDFSFESGGISLEAYKVLTGGTLVSSGTGGTETATFTKKATDARPFFQIEGQMISDSGGDVHCVIPRCRLTGELAGEFSDGTFYLTSASGVGLPSMVADQEDVIYQIIQNKTAKDITPPGGGSQP